MKDYYKILGVHPSVTAEEIKEAYRRLANKYHPDVGGDAVRFKEIKEAYDLLSDAYQRGVYDAMLLVGHSRLRNDVTNKQSDYQIQERKIKDSKRGVHATALIFIAIMFWILGDQSDHSGLLVFLGWVFLALGVYRLNRYRLIKK